MDINELTNILGIQLYDSQKQHIASIEWLLNSERGGRTTLLALIFIFSAINNPKRKISYFDHNVDNIKGILSYINSMIGKLTDRSDIKFEDFVVTGEYIMYTSSKIKLTDQKDNVYEVLPCPVCGSKNLTLHSNFDFVRCNDCKIIGPQFDGHPYDAVDEWNGLHTYEKRK